MIEPAQRSLVWVLFGGFGFENIEFLLKCFDDVEFMDFLNKGRLKNDLHGQPRCVQRRLLGKTIPSVDGKLGQSEEDPCIQLVVYADIFSAKLAVPIQKSTFEVRKGIPEKRSPFSLTLRTLFAFGNRKPLIPPHPGQLGMSLVKAALRRRFTAEEFIHLSDFGRNVPCLAA